MSKEEPERIFIATGRLKKALSLANLLSTILYSQKDSSHVNAELHFGQNWELNLEADTHTAIQPCHWIFHCLDMLHFAKCR